MPRPLSDIRKDIDQLDEKIVDSLFDVSEAELSIIEAAEILPEELSQIQRLQLRFSAKTWQLINARMKLSQEVIQAKKKEGRNAVLDTTRKQKVIDNAQSHASEYARDEVRKLYEIIHDISVRIQMALKICVLEWPGSYGDQVGKKIFPGSIPTYIESNAAIVEAILDWEEEWSIGILPVSNLYGGEVNESWKSLEKYRDRLVVAGSFSIKPDHAIVRPKEHAGKEVKRIISHQQAYDQSKHELMKLYPGHVFVPSKSTIGALKMIENENDVVICSAQGIRTNEHLKKAYFIEHENISPDDNETKFLVIATRKTVSQVMNLRPSDIDTLMVRLTNKPRQLANKLVLLSYILGVNIHEWDKTKVEPGVKPTYYAQFITDRIPRNWITKAIMKYFGVSPIPLKEDLVL